MTRNIVFVYFIFQGINLLRVSLDLVFNSGLLLISFDHNLFFHNLYFVSQVVYLGSYGFDLLFLIIAHAVLFFGFFARLMLFLCYIVFIFLFFLFKSIIFHFLGDYLNSAGLANFFFYFFNLISFWILEIGLLPIGLSVIESIHE
jgi:hypothetical protein